MPITSSTTRENFLEIVRQRVAAITRDMLLSMDIRHVADGMGMTREELDRRVDNGDFSVEEFELLARICRMKLVLEPERFHEKEKLKEKENEMENETKYEYVVKVHTASGKTFPIGPFQEEEDALNKMDAIANGTCGPVRTQRGSLVQFGLTPDAIEVVRFTRKD